MNIDGSAAAAAAMRSRKNVGCYRIIIAGASGLGKSTARQCLLHAWKKDRAGACAPSPDGKTLEISTSDAIEIELRTTDSERQEGRLRIVDTPGHGDCEDITQDIGKTTDYIEQQYDVLYHATNADGRVNPSHHDSLVTCCFHFIAPLRGCTDNDIAFMQEVSKWVPIVPVIAQADKMTSEETRRFRKTVSDTLKQANIRCYDFGQDRQTLARCGFAQARRARDDDPVAPDVLARVAAAGDPPVFTLIADRREYAWGTCEMENADHSDFTLLRDLVIQGHLEVSVFLSWPGPLSLPAPCVPPSVVSGAAAS